MLLGFLVGTVPVFPISFIPFTKAVHGMYLNQVIVKYISFKSRRSQKVLKKGE